jgi:hypothetical protein
MSTYPADPPCDSSQPILRIQEAIVERCACGCGKPLTGRQEKYASGACAEAMYQTARPRILNASAGAPREGTIKRAVMDFLGMNPGWHSAHDIAAAIKADKHSVVTRISELRSAFIPIEEDLPVGNSRRSHRYRLVQRG